MVSCCMRPSLAPANPERFSSSGGEPIGSADDWQHESSCAFGKYITPFSSSPPQGGIGLNHPWSGRLDKQRRIQISNSGYDLAISPQVSREFCQQRFALGKQGRRECRTLGASAAACVLVVSTRVSHHGHAGNVRHSPRSGVNGLFRALLGDRAFLSPSLAEVAFHKLDAGVEASGPHVFAVRKRRPRQKRRPRPPHPAPTSVTIAIRPSSGTGRQEYAGDLGPV
jgi:hypothetical protein